MLKAQTEPWKEFYCEAGPLFPRHWEEMALDRDLFTIDMDAVRYAALDAQGAIDVTTVRADGELVGYVICFVITHMHYCRSGLMALADMYWVKPERRKGNTFLRLFGAMEDSLRKRGVVKAHMSCKLHQDHTKLFEYMGWKLTDLTFGKVLCR